MFWCMKVISEMGLVLLLIHFFIGHTATEKEYLPSPSNITIGIKTMVSGSTWELQWTWKPPVVNCTLVYPSIITDGSGKGWPMCSGSSYLTIPLFQVLDLNNFSLDFKACCEPIDRCAVLKHGSNSQCNDMESKGIHLHTPLAAGEGNTSVRNLSCVWYYLEHVNCTWQPAKVVPANVNYSLHYWAKGKNTHYNGPAELEKIIDTGEACHSYITNEDGINVGCQFQLQKSLKDQTELLIVVTDKIKNIKPFTLFKRVNYIVKPRPPTIYNLSRTPNQSLYISWNTSHVNENLLYEVAYRMSTNENEEYIRNIEELNTEILNVLSDTYAVKVRARNGGNGFWSDWSKEEIITDKEHNRTIAIITIVVFPIIIVIPAVILAIYIRRIKILLFPKIPSPGKMFQEDFQEWIKNGSMNHFNKPQKEEVCPVSVLEMPLTPMKAD
ncbi:interleukin-13 receptor subunit alpha-1-like [Lithobates pipiens]